MEKMPINTFKAEKPGGVKDIMTANPANVEHMLNTNFENYNSSPRCLRLRDFECGRRPVEDAEKDRKLRV
ncbi:hypothetical protein SUGI_1024010 [Cryptomeria japonica]|nr:hypothetical protein SUGI_1024010 [Cryptomeria japonica]